MIGSVIKFFTGGGLSTITDALTKAHSDRLNADNDTQRIAADISIAQLTARQNVMINSKWSWMSVLVRASIVAPFILYRWKLIVYDKMLGLGATDGLSEQMLQIEMLAYSFYFLHSVADTAMTRFKK